jgi:hypothetical protein
LLRVEEGSLFVDLKMKSFKKTRDEERAIRVTFRWRKASVPNHLLPMLYLQDYYALIGTWRTTQENSTTTRHMALSWLII